MLCDTRSTKRKQNLACISLAQTCISLIMMLKSHKRLSSRPANVTESVTLHAFKTGYRHVDSARVYRNEQPCADAIRASGIPREEIFFTSKVPPRSMGYEATKVSASGRSCDKYTLILTRPAE